MRVAVDLMGGDHNSLVAIKACLNVATKYSSVQLILVGNSQAKTNFLNSKRSNTSFVECNNYITMEDNPKKSLNQSSSMDTCLTMLKNDVVDAVVSSGNTGSLVTLSKNIIGTINNINKISIFSEAPNSQTKCFVTDLGANLNLKPEELVSLAELAVKHIQSLHKITCPVVKVLNIGSESNKGTSFMQETHNLCKNNTYLKDLYKGFIEGDGIFVGDANLILCKGVHGNIAIKSAEGVSSLFKKTISNQIGKFTLRGVLVTFLSPFIKYFLRDIKPEKYSGAILLGLKKIVIKTHGNSNIAAWENAIVKAIKLNELTSVS